MTDEQKAIHIVEFGPDSWAVLHPVECRSNGLQDCRYNTLVNAMPGLPPDGVGRYAAKVCEHGNLILEAIE